MRNRHLAFILFFAVSTAQSAVPLNGEYQLAGPLSHKGEPTRGDSHLYVNLTDDAAKILFHALTGKASKDMCTGYNTKGRGNLVCYEVVPEKEYFCGFSVNLTNNKVEAGLGGCI